MFFNFYFVYEYEIYTKNYCFECKQSTNPNPNLTRDTRHSRLRVHTRTMPNIQT